MAVNYNLSQNTPLTLIWMTGFEFTDRDREALINSYGTSTGIPHERSGTGGARRTNLAQFATLQTPSLVQVREIVIGTAMYLTSSVINGDRNSGPYMQLATVADGVQCSIMVTQNREFRFAGGSGYTVWSESGIANPGWNWLSCRVFIDNSGSFDIRHQTYKNLVLTATGVDTQTAASNYVDRVQWRNPFSGFTGHHDDTAIFARSMYYTAGAGGSGQPVSGNTLANGLGATATIDFVTDDGAGNGVVFVSQVSGSFSTSDSLNDGSGWTATASNDLANDEASLFIPELFMFNAYPDADVGLPQWSTTGVNNFGEVDDEIDTATYVSTGTAAQLDEYSLTNVIPAGSTIWGMKLTAYARQQGAGSVTAINLGYNDGTGTEVADNNFLLPTGFAETHWLWTNNTRTGAKFTESEINSMTYRLTSVA